MSTGSAPSIFTGFLCASLGYILWILLGIFFSKRPRFAPGPKEHPVVGHTFQVPKVKVWRYFEKLSSQHGPIIRLSLAGDEILVLNDPSDAEELLSRRSHNYSSRKPLIYAGKYQSHNKRLVLLPYGPELKKQRAAFYQMLQPRVIGSYERMQELESTKLMYDMLTRPEDADMNAKRYAASLVFTLSYGRRLGDDDKDLLAVLGILDNFIADCYPGAHLVDTFPILDKILPDFLAPWRAAAGKKHENEMKLYTRLVLEVKEKMDKDQTDLECFAARLWEQQEKLDLDLTTLSYGTDSIPMSDRRSPLTSITLLVAGSAFEAGTGTTAGSFLWFLMAMILFPETMHKAHAELKSVLGTDGETIPTFEHLDRLPYCVALTKEVFRWMPAAPGGFPHYSDAEDEYKGYTIKANTMVIPCVWSMQVWFLLDNSTTLEADVDVRKHNEKLFPNPLAFDPDRFLQSKVSSPNEVFTEGSAQGDTLAQDPYGLE
ncbi:hypothetical protein C0995_016198 [Termitomyces sp. Mi166|nr:hypothetical protein C0995_016198 [Termitomyces sp. Mi166\